MGKKIINICGTGRSGSTMLDLMIGNDDKGFSLGEVHAFFRPFRTHHKEIICSCGEERCPWAKMKKFKENEFYEKAFEFLNVDFLVDSSKSLSWVIDNYINLQDKPISIYNILLYKEPISFFYSHWKRGGSLEKAHKDFKQYYNRFFQTDIPFISVNYNELAFDTEKTLKRICELVGISYFPGKERFWEKVHHQAFGSMGTRKQVEKKSSDIKKYEDFPEKYKKIIPELEIQIKDDVLLENTIEKLKHCELKINNNRDNPIRIKKHYWYYLQKLKQKYRQLFPEKWKTLQ